MRARKTIDEYHVQCNYGYGHGWETVTVESDWKECKQRVKEYKDNEGFPIRWLKKRVKKEEI